MLSRRSIHLIDLTISQLNAATHRWKFCTAYIGHRTLPDSGRWSFLLRFRLKQIALLARIQMPGTIAILCLIFASSVRASDAWVDQQTTGRFEVRSEVPLRQSLALEEFVRALPSHESDIAATLNLRLNQKPIVINVFQSRRNYLEFMTQYAPEGKRRRALFVQSKSHGSVFVYLHEDTATDLRHETTHAILHSSLPFLPLWLDEGLAEYFEVPRESRASGHPHQGRVKLDARLIVAWHPDLARLESLRDQTGMNVRRYRESWAWVHFLLHGPDQAAAILTGYLANIQAHVPPGPLSHQLREIWTNPERQLTSHMKSWK